MPRYSCQSFPFGPSQLRAPRYHQDPCEGPTPVARRFWSIQLASPDGPYGIPRSTRDGPFIFLAPLLKALDPGQDRLQRRSPGGPWHPERSITGASGGPSCDARPTFGEPPAQDARPH